MRTRTRIGLLVVSPVLLILFLKVFVADVYRVDSGSMKPTIHGALEGGELVLVRFDRHPRLERHDLVVLRREGEREPIVKRVAGLPGEELRIRDGDLIINGAKQGPRAARPPFVLVFDSSLHAIAELFELSGAPVLGEPDSGDPALSTGAEPVQACWRLGLNVDNVDPAGVRVPGRNPVGDGLVECDLRFTAETSGLISLSLSEEGDVFSLRVAPAAAAGQVELSVLRSAVGVSESRLGGARVEWPAGQTRTLRFGNVDDVLLVELDGLRVLELPYRSNTPLVGAPDPRLVHRRPRVCLASVGARAEFEAIRILRDLHYTDFGDVGVLGPVSLADDELFCLGDHSAESLDGRTFGPLGLDELVGVPVAVVWPPERARWLRSVVAPAPLVHAESGADAVGERP